MDISPMASLVLTDSSQLTVDSFKKLPDQITYPTTNQMIFKNIHANEGLAIDRITIDGDVEV
uniref:Uncharacterized protein n=1 Tax=Timema shepardi TaxID=629360 RepID=A0A7R9G689_TIMSH|nr:unnamed protein product [Timema shepardi]